MKSKSNYAMEMTADGQELPVKLIAGIVEGAMNTVPLARIEFVSNDLLLDLGEFVGKSMDVKIFGEDEKQQYFCGICVCAEYLGSSSGNGHYLAEIRPWIWFLSRKQDNRIFQNQTTTEIVKNVLSEHGFSANLKTSLSGAEAVREYCVQYRETDLEFITRLLEEEGIYFFFQYKDSQAKMVLADSIAAHSNVKVDSKLPFRDDEAELQLDHFYRWDAAEKVVSGKVTLDDYNFERPKADLTSVASKDSGSHTYSDYEIYKYPGRYLETEVGENFSKYQMDATAAAFQSWSAEGNILNLGVGDTFELIDHPRHDTGSEDFMITELKQYFLLEAGSGSKIKPLLKEREAFGLSEYEHTRIQCKVVRKDAAFRMPEITPKPEIHGVQTAVVTGPSGEEIHTDKYGRIRVQFHWDREGKYDDKTTCWIRTMMPVAGKNWGTIAIPRIGHEVVIQFEEGNPDRPICTGVLYNADNMPPYELPKNATRMGMKTNSSKSGGGFSELMFEDKKGDELVRFQSEKDYVQTIKNSAHVKVGYPYEEDCLKAEADGEKSMKVEIENNLDEIIEKGNHTFTVSAGEQTIAVKKDKTETIEGKSTQVITGNVTETVKQGNVKREIKSGNESTTISMGNFTLDTKAGKIDMTAMQSITLKVGPSSIKIDPSGVTIKGPMIKIEGTAMIEAKAPMTQVKGDAMLVLKGGLTTIN
ncbi:MULTISPECIES: type VI secretion system Vgr family protein [Falsihalocynthiibacter]|uniref:type VI secretion system Vgr family protein n=1 Tax=Falsihalocynthiibacter TaxID=2854182 RepID=UPI003002D2EF